MTKVDLMAADTFRKTICTADKLLLTCSRRVLLVVSGRRFQQYCRVQFCILLLRPLPQEEAYVEAERGQQTHVEEDDDQQVPTPGPATRKSRKGDISNVKWAPGRDYLNGKEARGGGGGECGLLKEWASRLPFPSSRRLCLGIG